MRCSPYFCARCNVGTRLRVVKLNTCRCPGPLRDAGARSGRVARKPAGRSMTLCGIVTRELHGSVQREAIPRVALVDWLTF